MKGHSPNGFTTKRANQKKHSYVSFVSERREQSRYSGFTLIETMVAVTILALAISGPLFAASRAIVAAEVSRDQLTASYLAQEGVEYVSAMRDDAYLVEYKNSLTNTSINATTAGWNDFLNVISSCHQTVSSHTQACSFDPVGTSGVPSLSSCTGGVCPPLYLANNGQTNYYTTNPSAPGITPSTAFTRTIQVVDASTNGATDVRVVSTVAWSFHGTPYTVTVTDHLTPWQ